MATKKAPVKKTKITKEKKTKKIVEEKIEEQPAQEIEETSTPQEDVNKKEADPVKVEIKSNVMQKKDWIQAEKVKEIVVAPDTHDWKIQVKCTGNCGSFNMGQTYRVSPKIFEEYKAILEIVD